ncbi:LPS-assembly lipoprotein [Burkholderia sp. b14]|nr:LPS-assembly lipoprotein [Burkholderia sp. b13]SIT78882.1 LPS-assembly lipoprotein [Burkholderia sp. b14]
MTESKLTRRSCIVLAAAALLLAGCGFQLRGNYGFPFKRLALVGPGPELGARIQRLVEGGSQTRIVKSTDGADVILSISEGRGTGALTLNAAGQVNEYELDYTMSYQLVGADGTVLLPPSVIRINRAMTYSDQYALAKSQEFELLYRDMRNDALDQLLRRMSAVRELHPAHGGVRAVAPRAPLPTPPL